MEYVDQREKLLDYIRQGCQDGLIRLSAGNFSLRINDRLLLITPAGIQYQSMGIGDLSIIGLDGDLVDGPAPSSETPMHTAIYQQIPRARAICHTHSVFGMVFAQLEEDIPLINIEMIICGGPIPVAPWAPPGTRAAGEVAVNIFRSRPDLRVLLLRKHGLLAIGSSLEEAYSMAVSAEIGLEVYYKTSLITKPQPLTEDQLNEIREVYRT